jgi:hypothetical protein
MSDASRLVAMLVFMFLSLQRNFVKLDLFSCSTVFALWVSDKTTVVLTLFALYLHCNFTEMQSNSLRLWCPPICFKGCCNAFAFEKYFWCQRHARQFFLNSTLNVKFMQMVQETPGRLPRYPILYLGIVQAYALHTYHHVISYSLKIPNKSDKSA